MLSITQKVKEQSATHQIFGVFAANRLKIVSSRFSGVVETLQQRICWITAVLRQTVTYVYGGVHHIVGVIGIVGWSAHGDEFTNLLGTGSMYWSAFD